MLNGRISKKCNCAWMYIKCNLQITEVSFYHYNIHVLQNDRMISNGIFVFHMSVLVARLPVVFFTLHLE